MIVMNVRVMIVQQHSQRNVKVVRIGWRKKMVDEFWKPKYKWQLVEWLSEHFNETAKKFERMTFKRLYAIYMCERRRGYGEESVCRGRSR